MKIFWKKKIALFFFVVLFLPSIAIMTAPQKAEALEIGAALVGCTGADKLITGAVSGFIKSIIPGIGKADVVPTEPVALTFDKECMDALAYSLAKELLARITDDIISWINSGFNGDPLFLTDPLAYFKEIRDREIQNAIYQTQNQASIYARQLGRDLIRSRRKNFDKRDDFTLGKDIAKIVCEQEVAKIQKERQSQISTDVTKETPTLGYLKNLSFIKNIAQIIYAPAPDGTTNPDNVQSGDNQTIQVNSTKNDVLVSDFGTNASETYSFYDSSSESDKNIDPVTGVNTSNIPDCNDPATLAAQQEKVNKYTNDFRNGGWDAWISQTQNQNNNPIGARQKIEDEITRKQEGQVHQKEQELLQNNGFLGVTKCVEYAVSETGGDDAYCLKEKTITPGEIVKAQAEEVTTSSIRQLELADQMNESLGRIFDALVNQLINKGLEQLGTGVGSDLAREGINSARDEYLNQRQSDRDIQRSIDEAEINLIKMISAREKTENLASSAISTYRSVSLDVDCPNTRSQAEQYGAKMPQYENFSEGIRNEKDMLKLTLSNLRKIKDAATKSKDYTGLGTDNFDEIANRWGAIARSLPSSGDVYQAESLLEQINYEFDGIKKLNSSCQKEIAVKKANANANQQSQSR